jgi:hypothetical protein
MKKTLIFPACHGYQHYIKVHTTAWKYHNMFMLAFIFMITCGLLLFLISVLEIQLTNLSNPPHLCACPKPGPGFPTPYVLVFVVLWFVIRGGSFCCYRWSYKRSNKGRTRSTTIILVVMPLVKRLVFIDIRQVPCTE